MLSVIKEAEERSLKLDSRKKANNKFDGGIAGDFTYLEVGDTFKFDKDYEIFEQYKIGNRPLTTPIQYINIAVKNEKTGDLVTAKRFIPRTLLRNLGVVKLTDGVVTPVEDTKNPGRPMRAFMKGEVVDTFKKFPDIESAMEAFRDAECEIKVVAVDHFDVAAYDAATNGVSTTAVRSTPFLTFEFVGEKRPVVPTYKDEKAA